MKTNLNLRIIRLVFLVVFVVLLAANSLAVSIGVSPGRVRFENVLKNGYSERTVTISTNSDEMLTVRLKPQGSLAEWMEIEGNKTFFNVSKGSPQRIKIKARPPIDARTANYTGEIEIITEQVAGISGRAGSVIKASVLLSIELEVTGKEIVECRAGAFYIDNVEEGFQLGFGTTVINDGNVRLAPLIGIEIWDQEQKNLILAREVKGDEALPSTEIKMGRTLQNSLAVGQYWAELKVKECDAKNLLTFSVVEKGAIVDNGELTQITNKPWAFTNETVQITAQFQNSGQRQVAAKLKGAIRLDDQIVQIVDTEEQIVPSGKATTFDLFFTPEKPGRYTFTGRVTYNKKLTFERGTVLNVNEAEAKEASKFAFLPLIIFLIISVTLLIIVRKIIKERKKILSP